MKENYEENTKKQLNAIFRGQWISLPLTLIQVEDYDEPIASLSPVFTQAKVCLGSAYGELGDLQTLAG